MTSVNDDEQEMSMDEILASIRRYVSSDEPTKRDIPQAKPAVTPAPQPIAKPQNTDPYAAAFAQSPQPSPYVNMQSSLQQPSREPSREPSLRAAPLHEFLQPSQNPAPTYNSQQDDVVRLNTNRPAPVQAPQPLLQPAQPTQSESLVSDSTLSSTLASFSRLNDTLTQQTTTYKQTDVSAQSSASAEKLTLDQMFYELARPMIREWLDRNLPPMVESMVAKEIDRITKGVRR